MGLQLTAQDVAALEERTEGWIAALQLAALSMQGRDDVAGFIAGFAGDDRYIVDYLVEEVVQRQPDQVRTFLLHTSILARLNGPLCDAVTGQDGGKAMLEALDRGNLFLVPLDDRRRWYRYHHLFADVLQARLLDEQPDLVAELHRRASDWYARERRTGRGHPSRAGRRGLRAGRGPGGAGDAGHAQGPAGGHAARLARAAARGALRGPARAQQRLRRGTAGHRRPSRASSRACGTPSVGSTRPADRARAAPDGRRDDEEFRRLPAGSPSTAPDRR